jgi:hypothetical protein
MFKHIGQAVVGVDLPESVPDPVVSGEVGAGLRGGNNIIRGQGIFGVGQADIDDLGPAFLEDRHGLRDAPRYLRVQPLSKIFLGQADFHPLHAAGKTRRVVGHRDIQGGGVAPVMAGNGRKQQGRVLYVFRDGADLIQRRGVGHEPVPAHPAVGRLEPHDAAV